MTNVMWKNSYFHQRGMCGGTEVVASGRISLRWKFSPSGPRATRGSNMDDANGATMDSTAPPLFFLTLSPRLLPPTSLPT